MRRFVRENSLGLFFGLLFLGALVGQAIAGHNAYNQTASSCANAVAENWQSEYLQFMLFMLATVWLLQRGSPESKELDRPGRESAEDQKLGRHAPPDAPGWARAGDWRTGVYSKSKPVGEPHDSTGIEG